MATHVRLYQSYHRAVAAIDRLHADGGLSGAIALVLPGASAKLDGAGSQGGTVQATGGEVLVALGVGRRDAEFYTGCVGRGDTLLTIRAFDGDDARIIRLLSETGPLDAALRERRDVQPSNGHVQRRMRMPGPAEIRQVAEEEERQRSA